MNKFLHGLVTTAICLLSVGSALASVTNYSSQAGFSAQGTIVFNSNFSDFGAGFGLPGDPFTRGDVTYRSTQNLTWGSGTGYTTTEPLIGNNFWTPILGDIATGPAYNMFGFDIGTYNKSPISIDVFTNVGAYSYPGLTIADSQAGLLEFLGFVASAGEFFTGFQITADNGPGNLPGITHVQVGHADGGTIPEPATVSLILLGLAAAGGLRRRAGEGGNFNATSRNIPGSTGAANPIE